MQVKEESEKAGFKLNIQETKIMESSPIISWQKAGETMETVTDFIFLGSKITADGDCSHKIKRQLLLGTKAMINLDSVLKRRDNTLLTKVHIVKMIFFFFSSNVQMWVLDCQDGRAPSNWHFWIVVLEKTLESPLDSKEIKPVDPKGYNPEYSLEGLILKLQYLAIWCKQPTHWIWPWCWVRLRARGEGGYQGWDGWMASLTQRTWVRVIANCGR